jgi:hypothetical protein
MALLERKGPAVAPASRSLDRGPSAYDGLVRDLFEARFGIDPSFFASLAFHTSNKKMLHAVTIDHDRPESVPFMQCGMPFLRLRMAQPKPTTAAVLFVGHLAGKNWIELDFDRAIQFLTIRTLSMRRTDLTHCTGRGYVILRRAGTTLGLGFLDGDGDGSTLTPKLPGFWRYTP